MSGTDGWIAGLSSSEGGVGSADVEREGMPDDAWSGVNEVGGDASFLASEMEDSWLGSSRGNTVAKALI